ncbi:MAG: DUF192 domain-containing protein [Patescibacteria group bacterium]
MPNNAIAKIVLAPNRFLVVLIIAGFIAAVASLNIISIAGRSCDGYRTDQTVEIFDIKLKTEKAKTVADQQKGLGGRECIAPDQAMLFELGVSGKNCFWMKNMRFSIDIIWLDSENRVVHLEQNVNPNTFPKTFCPKSDAVKVLEIQAGQAKNLNIELGGKLSL